MRLPVRENRESRRRQAGKKRMRYDAIREERAEDARGRRLWSTLVKRTRLDDIYTAQRLIICTITWFTTNLGYADGRPPEAMMVQRGR